jgi:hypothetical protein
MWRKILIGLVIAIPLAYGGIKLYAAHSISKSADKMIIALAPVAEIRYQGTTSSVFGGMVGLTGVTVHVLKTNDFYRIGAVKLKSDNLFTLLDMGGKLQRGEVPKTFGIKLQKLTLPMSGHLLNKSDGNLGLLGDMGLPYGSLPCGSQSGFSASDLEQMGIDQITTDMTIGVRREPEHNDVRILLNVDTPGVNAADIDMRLAVANGALSPRAMKSVPKMEAFSLKFRDQGWHKRVQAFCTRRTGLSRAAWLAAHIKAVKAALARKGIGVGDTLLGAYRSFLRDGGTLTLTFAPQNPIDPDTLHLYSIQDAMYYLAPALTVNGKRIPNLDIASIKPEAAKTGNDSVAAIPGLNDNYNYRTIPLGTLGRYIGKRVRLTTDNRNVFAGKLVDVSGRIATVDVKNYGETDEEIVLLTRVVKTEVATSLKHPGPTAH